MPTNFHSDLPNDQIHAPKDFSVAGNSSVMVKDYNSSLDWKSSFFNLSATVTCGADVAGGLHLRYFRIYTETTSSSVNFEVNISVAGEPGTFTPTSGFTSVPINISPNDDAITIAAAIKTALDASPGGYDFHTSVDGTGKVTFSGMKNCRDVEDIDLSFRILNTKTFYGEQFLHSDTSGKLSFKTLPFEREFQMGALPTVNNSNVWLQKPITNVGNMGVDSGLTFPTVALAIRQALGGAVYHASEGDSFGYWRGVIGGVASFNIGLLRVKNDCTHATPNNGDLIVSQAFTLTDPDHGVCFDLTASFKFEESDLIVPIVYGTTLPGAWYGTTRLKINRE
jgi:hypothetical protein|tara:strand:+ start:27547 stop:28560 length:1014 start_codon:yes stop_codon:yes gene_type:complete